MKDYPWVNCFGGTCSKYLLMYSNGGSSTISETCIYMYIYIVHYHVYNLMKHRSEYGICIYSVKYVFTTGVIII